MKRKKNRTANNNNRFTASAREAIHNKHYARKIDIRRARGRVFAFLPPARARHALYGVLFISLVYYFFFFFFTF